MAPPKAGSPSAIEQPNAGSASEWSGAVFIGRRRIIFAGEAGTAKDQSIHALKICISLGGDFKLSIKSGVRDKSCSAVIINAGVTHTIEGGKNKFFLAYLLPETYAAQDLLGEYLHDRRGQFYDIPKTLIEESLPLTRFRRDHESWDCRDAFNACDEVIIGLGKIRHREISTSSGLSDKLGNVRSTIESIYSEAEDRKLGGKFDEEKFDHLEFKEKTGISIEHFFRDIQMLTAIRLFAESENGLPEEKMLVDKLEDPNLTDEEKAEIGARLNALPHRLLLREIAERTGIGSLALFGERIKSRLGISLADLRGGTEFYSCPEK